MQLFWFVISKQKRSIIHSAYQLQNHMAYTDSIQETSGITGSVYVCIQMQDTRYMNHIFPQNSNSIHMYRYLYSIMKS